MSDELRALTRAVVRAVRERDLALLEAALAPEFTLTTGRPGAEVRDRAAWLAITESRYDVEEDAVRELAVHPLGADGALVRYRLEQRARMDGADRSGAFRVSDAWARRDGAWRLVARHSTALPGPRVRLRALPGPVAIRRLAPGEEAPPPAGPLWALAHREDERSVVHADPSGGWRALAVEGPLDLALTGVLHALSAPLAAAGIPLFALSTHDTDVLLVPAERLGAAIAALRAAGHDLTA